MKLELEDRAKEKNRVFQQDEIKIESKDRVVQQNEMKIVQKDRAKENDRVVQRDEIFKKTIDADFMMREGGKGEQKPDREIQFEEMES